MTENIIMLIDLLANNFSIQDKKLTEGISLVSRISKGEPPVAIKRGEESQMKWCREPRCSPRGTSACRGTVGVAGRLSGTVSPFRAEQGTSLETPWRARASSCEEVGTTCFFSS